MKKWYPDERKQYIISKWHVLQYIYEYGKNHREEGVTRYKIAKDLGDDKRTISQKLVRLLNQKFISRRGKKYIVTKRARNFLKEQNIQSFLAPNNPRLKTPINIAKAMKRKFLFHI